MSNKQFAICCLSLLSLIGLTSWLDSQREDGDKAVIAWMSIEEAQERIHQDPRPIFVDVYTDWCKPCTKMDGSTFRDQKIVDYLNSYFYAVKLDAESQQAIIYQGDSSTAHIVALRDWMVRGYPAFVILQPDMGKPQLELGYKDQQELLGILQHYTAAEALAP